MNLVNYEQVIKEINAYFSQEGNKPFLFVNCENYSDFNNIVRKYKADASIKIIYLSDFIKDDAIPKVREILINLKKEQDKIILVGLSQFLHFTGNENVQRCLAEFYAATTNGHTVILLEHCQSILEQLTTTDKRRKRQTILADGSYGEFPKINVIKNKEYCKKIQTFQALLNYLEQTDFKQNSNNHNIYASFTIPKDYFSQSSYQVIFIESNFDLIKTFYPNESVKLKLTDGNEEQWEKLLSDLNEHKTIINIFKNYLKKSTAYEYVADAIKNKTSIISWYFWLKMKYFTSTHNKYLSLCFEKTNTSEELEHTIYFTILDYPHNHPLFKELYQERKKFLKECNMNLKVLDEYLDSIHKFQKNCIYYLTDNTDKEQQAIMRSLANYSYDYHEVLKIAELISSDLYAYLMHFEFKQSNLKLPESDTNLYEQFNQYFDQYKFNKIINKIPDDFIELVNKNALLRPYNKIQTRLSIINKLQSNNTKVFFIDALGVEYLAYIQQKCSQNNMNANIQIAKSELPSITEINKDFYNIFKKDDLIEIQDIDKMKHEDQLVDYKKCKEPIHIFKELAIIKTILERIQTDLSNKIYEKALIISDHGASRLAVIYEHDSTSTIELTEKGKHSGRCCPVENDPQLPNCTYENGYAVLANYDRFKGSRKASVEVHGGASLEEVLVPIINISLKQENKLHFENPIVLIKPKEIPELILISSKPLNKPILEVGNKKYQGEHIDRNHYKFKMPDMKRTKTYQAKIYDDNEEIGELSFSTQSNLVKNNDDMLL